MRVLIIGAGVGGLTAALALCAAGHAVTVIERSDRFADVGAGVQLGANATRILIRLGLERSLRAAACAPLAVEIRAHETGGLLMRTPLGASGEARWGAPYLQLHRADLHAILLAAVRDAGAEIRLGCEATRLSGDDRTATVHLKRGQAEGEQGVGDLVVACDGVRSAARDGMFGATSARFTGQVAWRARVPVVRLEGLELGPTTVWTGAGRHLVRYPIRAGALVNVVGVVDNRTWTQAESWSEPGSQADFARDFADWPAAVTSLIAAADECWLWAIHTRPPSPAWRKGRIALLGDAAHPMVPFLAQGAGMAIEDAESLGRNLARAPTVAQALDRYSAERRVRVARVAGWAHRNGRLFHLPLPLRRLAFAAAQAAGGGEAALDWLYGYDGAALHG